MKKKKKERKFLRYLSCCENEISLLMYMLGCCIMASVDDER